MYLLRFGLIGGVVAYRDIQIGEELNTACGYPIEGGPKWYRELFKKEFPSEDIGKVGSGNQNQEDTESMITN